MSQVAARALDLITPGGQAALRLVRRRKRKLIRRSGSSKIVTIAIATTIGLTGIVAAVLLEQVTLVQSAFKLADLRKDVLQAQDRHEELMLEAANLDSAARIENYARDTLGMVDPAPESINYIVADVRGAARGRIRIPAPRAAENGAGLAGSSAYDDPYAADAPSGAGGP
jgi:cell division protein FtsB